MVGNVLLKQDVSMFFLFFFLFFFFTFKRFIKDNKSPSLLPSLSLCLGRDIFHSSFSFTPSPIVMYVFRQTAFHAAHTFKHSKFCMTVLLIICPLTPAQTQRWCVSRVCLGLTHLTLCCLASSTSLSHCLCLVGLKKYM